MAQTTWDAAVEFGEAELGPPPSHAVVRFTERFRTGGAFDSADEPPTVVAWFTALDTATGGAVAAHVEVGEVAPAGFTVSATVPPPASGGGGHVRVGWIAIGRAAQGNLAAGRFGSRDHRATIMTGELCPESRFAGSGPQVTAPVHFPEEFRQAHDDQRAAPTVLAFIAGADMMQGSGPLALQVCPTNVTKTGCRIAVSTRGGCRLNAVTVAWVALSARTVRNGSLAASWLQPSLHSSAVNVPLCLGAPIAPALDATRDGSLPGIATIAADPNSHHAPWKVDVITGGTGITLHRAGAVSASDVALPLLCWSTSRFSACNRDARSYRGAADATVCGVRVTNELLGQGTWAEVKAGIRAEDGARVAVKRSLKPFTGGGPGASHTALFRQEIRCCRKVPRHHGLMQCYGATVVNNRLCVILELVRGRMLVSALGNLGPMPARLAIVRHVFDALAALHAAGLAHRDVTAANVMIGGPTAVKFVDYGYLMEIDPNDLSATYSCDVPMDPVYTSPERKRPGPRCGAPDDVYCACVLAVGVLLGRAPRAAASEAAPGGQLEALGSTRDAALSGTLNGLLPKAGVPQAAIAALASVLTGAGADDPRQRRTAADMRDLFAGLVA